MSLVGEWDIIGTTREKNIVHCYSIEFLWGGNTKNYIESSFPRYGTK